MYRTYCEHLKIKWFIIYSLLSFNSFQSICHKIQTLSVTKKVLHDLLPTLRVQLHCTSFLTIVDAQLSVIPTTFKALSYPLYFSVYVSLPGKIFIYPFVRFFSFLMFQLMYHLFSQPSKTKALLILYHSTMLFSWSTLFTTCSHCIMCLFIWWMSVCSYEMCQKETEPDTYLRWQDILTTAVGGRDSSIN